MTRRRADKLANAVGLVTLGFGVVLTAMPRRSAAALGWVVAPSWPEGSV
ncbi:hypothetical protein [Micromonospora noduli]|nr:hypothetical protein [Micromonospora noduli]